MSIFFKKNKISLSKILTNKKYETQIKEKYQIEDYIIDIIKNNKEELESNIRSKKLYDSNVLKQYTFDDKKFLNNKSNNELLNYIKTIKIKVLSIKQKLIDW